METSSNNNASRMDERAEENSKTMLVNDFRLCTGWCTPYAGRDCHGLAAAQLAHSRNSDHREDDAELPRFHCIRKQQPTG